MNSNIIINGIENQTFDPGQFLSPDYSIKHEPQPENGDITQIWAFGLNSDNAFSYYIGLDWLDIEEKIALYVKPKIENMDYFAMFKTVVESPITRYYAHDIYDIRIDKPFIKQNNKEWTKILPLVMYHYLYLLSELVKKPLIKTYTKREENLNSKIKGKVLLSEHIKNNISSSRYDRIMCSYNEFSIDCPANRLLKSAYIICKQYLNNYARKKTTFSQFEFIENYFASVGLLNTFYELSRIKINSLYFEYKEAIRIAKIIFKYNSIQEHESAAHDNLEIPPYIIDMSKLFELFVYNAFSKNNHNIIYQFSGHREYPDFLDKNSQIVIDAKYKTKYGSLNEYKIEDIRQISGYARDKKVLRELLGNNTDNWNTVPRCLIVYPDIKGNEEIEEDYHKRIEDNPIKNFYRFYALGIKCPALEETIEDANYV
jgi:5-methylcytosine-specific restriction enzyme subunit McrC